MFKLLQGRSMWCEERRVVWSDEEQHLAIMHFRCYVQLIRLQRPQQREISPSLWRMLAGYKLSRYDQYNHHIMRSVTMLLECKYQHQPIDCYYLCWFLGHTWSAWTASSSCIDGKAMKCWLKVEMLVLRGSSSDCRFLSSEALWLNDFQANVFLLLVTRVRLSLSRQSCLQSNSGHA